MIPPVLDRKRSRGSGNGARDHRMKGALVQILRGNSLEKFNCVISVIAVTGISSLLSSLVHCCPPKISLWSD